MEPNAAQVVHIWAVRWTLASTPGESQRTGELLHLGWMFPKAVVTLGLHLGIHRTIVRDIDGKQYAFTEPEEPWEVGPHSIMLQTSHHHTVYVLVQKRISLVRAPLAALSAPSFMPPNKNPLSLYNLLGPGTAGVCQNRLQQVVADRARPVCSCSKR